MWNTQGWKNKDKEVINGVLQHLEELKLFITSHNIDVLQVFETYFTDRSFIKIPKYTIYITNHPTETIQSGFAVLIKSSIKPH